MPVLNWPPIYTARRLAPQLVVTYTLTTEISFDATGLNL